MTANTRCRPRGTFPFLCLRRLSPYTCVIRLLIPMNRHAHDPTHRRDDVRGRCPARNSISSIAPACPGEPEPVQGPFWVARESVPSVRVVDAQICLRVCITLRGVDDDLRGNLRVRK